MEIWEWTDLLKHIQSCQCEWVAATIHNWKILFSILAPDNTHLATDLKIEYRSVGLHILPKSGIWIQNWLLPYAFLCHLFQKSLSPIHNEQIDSAFQYPSTARTTFLLKMMSKLNKCVLATQPKWICHHSNWSEPNLIILFKWAYNLYWIARSLSDCGQIAVNTGKCQFYFWVSRPSLSENNLFCVLSSIM
jgi:hypothetical protein